MQGMESTIRLKQTLREGGSKQRVIRNIDWYLQVQLHQKVITIDWRASSNC